MPSPQQARAQASAITSGKTAPEVEAAPDLPAAGAVRRAPALPRAAAHRAVSDRAHHRGGVPVDHRPRGPGGRQPALRDPVRGGGRLQRLPGAAREAPGHRAQHPRRARRARRRRTGATNSRRRWTPRSRTWRTCAGTSPTPTRSSRSAGSCRASTPLTVLGLRISGSLAEYFAYAARRIHPDVRLVTRGGSVAYDALLQSREAGGTWVLAFSMPRHAQETLTAVRVARSAGLRVALITDLALGPLADEADVTFATGTGSRLVFDSYAGARRAVGGAAPGHDRRRSGADPGAAGGVRADRRPAPVLPPGLSRPSASSYRRASGYGRLSRASSHISRMNFFMLLAKPDGIYKYCSRIAPRRIPGHVPRPDTRAAVSYPRRRPGVRSGLACASARWRPRSSPRPGPPRTRRTTRRRRTPGSDDHAPDDHATDQPGLAVPGQDPRQLRLGALGGQVAARAGAGALRELPGADPPPRPAGPPRADPGPARDPGRPHRPADRPRRPARRSACPSRSSSTRSSCTPPRCCSSSTSPAASARSPRPWRGRDAPARRLIPSRGTIAHPARGPRQCRTTARTLPPPAAGPPGAPR